MLSVAFKLVVVSAYYAAWSAIQIVLRLLGMNPKQEDHNVAMAVGIDVIDIDSAAHKSYSPQANQTGRFQLSGTQLSVGYHCLSSSPDTLVLVDLMNPESVDVSEGTLVMDWICCGSSDRIDANGQLQVNGNSANQCASLYALHAQSVIECLERFPSVTNITAVGYGSFLICQMFDMIPVSAHLPVIMPAVREKLARIQKVVIKNPGFPYDDTMFEFEEHVDRSLDNIINTTVAALPFIGYILTAAGVKMSVCNSRFQKLYAYIGLAYVPFEKDLCFLFFKSWLGLAVKPQPRSLYPAETPIMQKPKAGWWYQSQNMDSLLRAGDFVDHTSTYDVNQTAQEEAVLAGMSKVKAGLPIDVVVYISNKQSKSLAGWWFDNLNGKCQDVYFAEAANEKKYREGKIGVVYG